VSQLIEKCKTPAPEGVQQRRQEILGDAAVLSPTESVDPDAAKSNFEEHLAATAAAPGADAAEVAEDVAPGGAAVLSPTESFGPVAAKSNFEEHLAATVVPPGADAEEVAEDAAPGADAEEVAEDAAPGADAEEVAEDAAPGADAGGEKEDAAPDADVEEVVEDAAPGAAAVGEEEDAAPRSKFCPRCGEPTLDSEQTFCEACRALIQGVVKRCKVCALTKQNDPNTSVCPEHQAQLDFLLNKSLSDGQRERSFASSG
jgi:hypothetical protein